MSFSLLTVIFDGNISLYPLWNGSDIGKRRNLKSFFN